MVQRRKLYRIEDTRNNNLIAVGCIIELIKNGKEGRITVFLYEIVSQHVTDTIK